MCRKIWIFVLLCVLIVPLAGCGTKDAKDVVSDLSKRSEDLQSYISHGKMTILSGQEPQEYDVEVWYKKPNYYRVALRNLKKNIVQILLRNDDGVYVLTPSLKKSFRFQSDWPYTGGQIYIYQTILQSIVDDQGRQFQAGKKDYRFEVTAKYPFNQQAIKQRIWLDHDLNPKKVDVLDEENDVLITVNFDRFKPNASFDKDAFDTERNLQTMPSQSQSKEALAALKQKDKDISSILPGFIPDGSRLVHEQTIQTPNGPVAILRFKGEKSFTLTERRPQEVAASLPMMGKPVELEQTIGVLLEMDDQKRLSWTYDGIDYELLGNLAEQEMVQIANSIYDQPSK
jgi:outer membrane lipoprotein-sorting protein